VEEPHGVGAHGSGVAVAAAAVGARADVAQCTEREPARNALTNAHMDRVRFVVICTPPYTYARDEGAIVSRLAPMLFFEHALDEKPRASVLASRCVRRPPLRVQPCVATSARRRDARCARLSRPRRLPGCCEVLAERFLSYGARRARHRRVCTMEIPRPFRSATRGDHRAPRHSGSKRGPGRAPGTRRYVCRGRRCARAHCGVDDRSACVPESNGSSTGADAATASHRSSTGSATRSAACASRTDVPVLERRFRRARCNEGRARAGPVLGSRLFIATCGGTHRALPPRGPPRG
jgi:hypothetical protein